MEHQPKTEPGLSSSDHRNLEDMSIHELVSVLRTSFLTEDFDNVEEVLVTRDKKLQTKILHLQEKFEMEKLTRFQVEEDVRKREELCERGKRAQQNYEALLKEVKQKTSLIERDNIGKPRKKDIELEFEVCELRKLNEKWVDDSNDLGVGGLLENEKNACEVKNSELEKSEKKNGEALAEITDFQDKDKQNVEIGKDIEDNAPLQTKEQGCSRCIIWYEISACISYYSYQYTVFPMLFYKL
ncbi:hypothetical protein MtrunA17_Chr5g0446171 [Medicago truncatula]|uniref:Uncharacterized protein n=1 Tax=Medicago truncatula TaxID=3880 RepID=A0A396I1D0_MEDTR|nr:hypothetical protein MtrunA17_Chr5g0446171 [Medicago truncatula]